MLIMHFEHHNELSLHSHVEWEDCCTVKGFETGSNELRLVKIWPGKTPTNKKHKNKNLDWKNKAMCGFRPLLTIKYDQKSYFFSLNSVSFDWNIDFKPLWWTSHHIN